MLSFSIFINLALLIAIDTTQTTNRTKPQVIAKVDSLHLIKIIGNASIHVNINIKRIPQRYCREKEFLSDFINAVTKLPAKNGTNNIQKMISTICCMVILIIFHF